MMSILPNESIAVWMSLSGASPLVRSPPKTAVSPLISPAACSATSPSRSLMTTLAPCSANSSAVARPMPRADPVTIATLSSRTPIQTFSLRSWKAGTLVRAQPPQRLADLLGRGALAQEVRARRPHALLDLVGRRGGHDEHARRVLALGQALERLPAVHPGHPQVEDEDVGGGLVDAAQAGAALAGLADHLQLGLVLQDGPHQRPVLGRVVADVDAHPRNPWRLPRGPYPHWRSEAQRLGQDLLHHLVRA